jgi:selenocysteine lyase/cysteine desulfurase
LDRIDPVFDPRDFYIEDGIAHLASGGLSPMLREHDDAFREFNRDKGLGMLGGDRLEAHVQTARSLAASVFHAQVGDIGLVSNVAEGMSILAESISWRDGDNVCVDGQDFASVVLPFLVQRKPAIEVRVAQGDDPSRFKELVDQRTRLVAIAEVSYVTGERHDLSNLRELVDQAGSMLVVDFTQNAGVFPVNAEIADFGFSSCYKFLLGATGTAIAYWNRRRQPDWAPNTAGWYSVVPTDKSDYTRQPEMKPDAGRISRGNMSHPSVYVLVRALQYLGCVEEGLLSAHIERLTSGFMEGLRRLEIPLLTPLDRVRRGPNVCVPSANANDLTRALEDRGILTWNGVGRVRFSFHGFNSSEDVARALDAMARDWRG